MVLAMYVAQAKTAVFSNNSRQATPTPDQTLQHITTNINAS